MARGLTSTGSHQHGLQIAPSILAGDFLHLSDAIKSAEAGGADRLHIDVMDGRFVPNISIGTPILSSIRSATKMLLETHLMIVEPERYVPLFSDMGADLIIVHSEVSPHLYRTLEHIQGQGKRAGVAINPATPWMAIEEVLDLADLVLVMTVSPGFGGQTFIEAMIPKIRHIRDELDRRGSAAELEVDGGIDQDTAGRVVEAGARVLVAGTAIFRGSESVEANVRSLRTAAENSVRSPGT